MERLARFFRVLAYRFRGLYRSSRLIQPPRLGAGGYLNPKLFEEAVRIHAQTDASNIADVLLKMGYGGEREQVQARAQKMGLAFADLDRIRIGQVEKNLLPVETVVRLQTIPLKKDGTTVWVAMANPHDYAAREEVAAATGCRVIPVMAVLEDLEKVLAIWPQ
jgi:type IV pilus assembly protein PilB